MRGLVLFNPLHGDEGPSIGEDDLEVTGLLSSGLSSAYERKSLDKFNVLLKN